MEKFLILIVLLVSGCSSNNTLENQSIEEPKLVKKSVKEEIKFTYDISPIISKNILSQVEIKEFLASEYDRELNILQQSNQSLKIYLVRARNELFELIETAKTEEDIRGCLNLQANLEIAQMSVIHTDLLIKELRQKSTKLKFLE